MEQEWYLAINGERSGPHSLGELKGLLNDLNPDARSVLVWNETMEGWQDPGKVPILAGAISGSRSESVQSAITTAPAYAGPGLDDPYAAPNSALVNPEAQPEAGEFGNHPLEVGPCIQTAWRLTLKHLGKLVGFGLIYFAVAAVVFVPLGILEGVYGVQEDGAEPEPAQIAVTSVSQIVQNLFSTFLGIGVVMYGLGVLRQQDPEIGLLFRGGPHFVSVLLSAILYALIVIMGLALLIIPGIYLAIRLGQYQALIIDRNLGPIEGLKASWEITRGNTWNLVVLGLALLGIYLLGVLALLVGLIWALPTLWLGSLAAYLCMSRGVSSLPRP